MAPDRGEQHRSAHAGFNPLLARGAPGLLLFGAVYMLLVLCGRALGVPPLRFPVLWPAAGFLLAALVVNTPARWPALVLVAGVAGAAGNLLYGGTYRPFSVPVFLANMVGTLPAAWLVRRWTRGESDIAGLRVSGALVVASALVAGPVAAVVAAGVLSLLRAPTGLTTLQTLGNWWVGLSAGLLTAAPAALALVSPPSRRSSPIEIAGAWTSLAVAGAALFLSSPSRYVPGILVTPPLLWIAIRLGSRASGPAVLALALGASLATVHGLGRFAFPSPVEQVFSLRLFLATVAATVTLVAAAVEDRRRAQIRLELLEAAVSRAVDAIAVQRPNGQLLWVNQAMARLLRRSPREVVGHDLWELVPGVTQASWDERAGKLQRLGSLVVEEAVPTPDGGTSPREVSAQRVEVGGQSYIVSVLRDIADRRRAEAALRVASIGTLAAGLAHEINNPLSFVTGNLEFLHRDLSALQGRPGAVPPGSLDAALEALADAAEGAARVRDIVRDLQLFSREKPGTAAVDLRVALRAALTMTQNEVRHRARLVTDFADPLPLVQGNEQRLVQVFVNLLANAAQAIPEGHAAENEIRVAVSAEGPELLVSVADTGSGISPEIQPRIFDPFFTTKVGAGGTGLGLSICQTIVSGLGGRIDVSSVPGRGTTFRVRLPALRGTAEAAGQASQPSAPAAPLPRSRLLVVDDEEKIGPLVQRLVGGEHEVTVCGGAREALDRIASGQPFDAVLCDLMMPDMSGMDFAARLEASAPALARRLAFMTGGAFTDAARAFLAGATRPTLPKPFDAAGLRRLLAALLAEEPGAPAGGAAPAR